MYTPITMMDRSGTPFTMTWLECKNVEEIMSTLESCPWLPGDPGMSRKMVAVGKPESLATLAECIVVETPASVSWAVLAIPMNDDGSGPEKTTRRIPIATGDLWNTAGDPPIEIAMNLVQSALFLLFVSLRSEGQPIFVGRLEVAG